MRHSDSKRVIDRDRYDAVLFDLDGVITNTARRSLPHRSAIWRRRSGTAWRRC
jgi:hypothetical protein